MAESVCGDMLDCTICVEKFVNPKILPCFHTFCCECLQQYIEKVCKGAYFDCPCCRANTKIPKNGAKGFQENFYIRESLELKKIESTKNTKDNNNGYTKDGYCGRHIEEQISFFCDLCKVTCCRDCKIDEHDGHPSVRLKELVDRLLPEADRLLSAVRAKGEKLNAQNEQLQGRLEFAKEEEQKLREDIKNRSRTAIEKIQETTSKALTNLKHVFQETTTSATAATESTKTSLERVSVMSESLSAAIASRNAITIMEQVTENRNEFDALPPPINTNALFAGLSMLRSADPAEFPIEDMFGKVITKRHLRDLNAQLSFISSVGVKVNNDFTLVTSILPVTDKMVWVVMRSRNRSERNSQLKKIDWIGRETESVNLPGVVNSMVQINDNIAVSLPFDNKICAIDQENNMYELTSLKRPSSMTVFGDNLFVSSIQSNDFRKIEANSVNRIFVLAFDGQIKRTIEYYDGKHIFTSPGRICSRYTGELLVADFVLNKIICIDTYGKPLSEYCFQGTKVLGVMCDESGYILAETPNGIIVLDGELSLVHSYKWNMVTTDISAVTVGPGGKLWTGSVKSQISQWKYIK